MNSTIQTAHVFEGLDRGLAKVAQNVGTVLGLSSELGFSSSWEAIKTLFSKEEKLRTNLDLPRSVSETAAVESSSAADQIRNETSDRNKDQAAQKLSVQEDVRNLAHSLNTAITEYVMPSVSRGDDLFL